MVNLSAMDLHSNLGDHCQVGHGENICYRCTAKLVGIENPYAPMLCSESLRSAAGTLFIELFRLTQG